MHFALREDPGRTAKDNYLAFEFSAPDFSLGNAIRYSYKSEDFDREWVDAGERNYMSYSNLPGDDYVFKVRVTNAAGVWGKDYASINITPKLVLEKSLPSFFYVCCACEDASVTAQMRFPGNVFQSSREIHPLSFLNTCFTCYISSQLIKPKQ